MSELSELSVPDWFSQIRHFVTFLIGYWYNTEAEQGTSCVVWKFLELQVRLLS